MPTPVLLPRDSSAAVQKYFDECQHLGLMLDKYQPWDHRADKWQLAVPVDEWKRRQWESGEITGNAAKGAWFGVGVDAQPLKRRPRGRILRRKISEQSEKWYGLCARIDAKLFEEFEKRWRAIASGAHALTFSCDTQSRLVVGLGGEHTLETAITLHRNYGIPIIPGSALKGVARAYAFFTLAEELQIQAVEPDEFKHRRIKVKPKQETPLSAFQGLLDANEKNWNEWVRKIVHAGGPPLKIEQLHAMKSIQLFRETFGWLGRTGGAIFFDAIPVTQIPPLEVDVMNPHYPKYYSGTEAPHDAQQPTPITFLTVAVGAHFQFAVAPNRYPADQPFAELGKQWLERALQWLGVGGKTLSGYGLFGAAGK